MKLKEIARQLQESRVDARLRAALAEAGIGSVLDAARALDNGVLPDSLRPHRRAIRKAARALRETLRDITLTHDPARRALRHSFQPSPELNAMVVDDSEYCDPASLQSMLSPARYLFDIYHLAASRITPFSPHYALNTRRPDLGGLALSEDNMNREVTTLSLANEVMTQYALKHPGNTNEQRLYELFAELTHPFHLPFDVNYATAREGLAAMKTELNAIARNTAPSAYALDQADYTLVPNTVDKLDLFDKHMQILSNLPTDLNLPHEVKAFLKYASIEYAELTDLLCAVNVLDEQGRMNPPDTTLASYVNANTAPHLRCENWPTQVNVGVAGMARQWGISTSWNASRKRLATASDTGFQPKEFVFEYLADGSFYIRLAESSGEYIVPLAEAAGEYEAKADKARAVKFRWEDGIIRDTSNGSLLAESEPLASHANARYIANGASTPTEFVRDGLHGSDTLAIARRGTSASQADLVRIAHLIRLNKATGLSFVALNQLIGLASTLHGLSVPTISERTLSVLARCVEWQSRFGLSVDEYCALIGRLNEFHREYHEETSLMRKLFGNQARWISSYVAEAQKRLSDLTAQEIAGVRHGLKLTLQEWDTITAEIDPKRVLPFDAQCLSTLYRFARVLPLLGWGVTNGIAMLEVLAPSLLTALAGAPTAALLTALDQMAWLSETLAAMQLTPLQAVAMLYQPPASSLGATQETVNRVNGLYRDLQPALLTTASFHSYEKVPSDSSTAGSVRIEWLAELSKLPSPVIPAVNEPVVDSHGLVRGYDTPLIAQVVQSILAAHGAAMAADVMEGVTAIVVTAQGNSRYTLAEVLSKDLSVGGGSIAPLLRWMRWIDPRIDQYYVLVTLMAANFEANGATDVARLNEHSAVLELFYDLGRYLESVRDLHLEELEIAMIAADPTRLAANVTGALGFRLQYFVGRLKGLQNASAKAADWVAYLDKANAFPPVPQAELRAVLAKLLNCDPQELSDMVRDLLGGQPPREVAQVDLLARHLRQAKAIAMSYKDLKTIKPLAGGQLGPPLTWATRGKAAEAVLIGLSNYGSTEETPLAITAAATTAPATLDAYLKASNTDASDGFGWSVAVSADGGTLAVGVPGEDSATRTINGSQTDNTAADAGAVYVFTRGSTGWVQEAYLKAANADAGDAFGHVVCLSDNGNTLAVGAPGENSASTNATDNSASDAGAAYIFARTAGNWTQQAYLKASNAAVNDRFGGALALSGDGGTVAVGATGEDSASTAINGDQASNAASEAGAVYVFVRSGSTWSQQAYVKASNADVNDLFGGAIALSQNGSTMAVGATGENSATTVIDGPQNSEAATDSGAVYVFTRTGTQWIQQSYIKASNADINDGFGAAVALSSDGNTLAASAPYENGAGTGVDCESDNNAADAGAVYLFKRSGNAWAQQAYVKASNTTVNDRFGWTLALSGDGLKLAVGTVFENSADTGINGNESDNSASDSGAVYLFAQSNGTWAQQAYVKASNTGVNDRFGSAVALTSDGAMLVAGAVGEDGAGIGTGGDPGDNSASNAGAVYIYRGFSAGAQARPTHTLTYLKASNARAADRFGTAVAVSADGNTLACGMIGNTGAVYVFVRTRDGWTEQACLYAASTGGGDQFGCVLALSSDGNTLAVGAIGEDSAATGVNKDAANNSAGLSGAAYVLVRTGTSWTQQAYIKASNTEASDGFGCSVALSGDGNMLAVGASGEDSAANTINGDQADNSAAQAGAAYVFMRSGSTWTQQAYVKGSTLDAGGQFGYAVALNEDGTTLAVGAPADRRDGATGVQTGTVYLFTRSGIVWTEQACVATPHLGQGDLFGRSISLSADGNTLAVGAIGEDSNATGTNGDEANASASDSGAAYVFVRTGTQWTKQSFVKAGNTNGNDQFGCCVALSQDGNTLAVGAVMEDSAATGLDGNAADNSATDSGAVYLYTRAGSYWSQVSYVKASNTEANDRFGSAVALSRDGTTLVAGAWGEDSAANTINGNPADNSMEASGAAYVYFWDTSVWSGVLPEPSNTAVKDRVDERGRDALVDYMLGHVLPARTGLEEVVNAEKLYEYLLLDVNVSAKMHTTRLLEAVGSVQLYINRAVDGIEPADFLDKPLLLEAWETDKEYRVWEANKKLFYYPGQYVDPNLLRNASSSYYDFSDALRQGKLGDKTVRAALNPYLAEIAAQGQATIGGISEAVIDDETVEVYVAARSAGDGGEWFLRTLRITLDGPQGVGPWERISVTFSKNKFLIPTPIRFQGRIHLVWCEIEQDADASGAKQTFIRVKRAHRIGQGEWSEPKTIRGRISWRLIQDYWGTSDEERFFVAGQVNSPLTLRHRKIAQDQWLLMSRFTTVDKNGTQRAAEVAVWLDRHQIAMSYDTAPPEAPLEIPFKSYVASRRRMGKSLYASYSGAIGAEHGITARLEVTRFHDRDIGILSHVVAYAIEIKKSSANVVFHSLTFRSGTYYPYTSTSPRGFAASLYGEHDPRMLVDIDMRVNGVSKNIHLTLDSPHHDDLYTAGMMATPITPAADDPYYIGGMTSTAYETMLPLPREAWDFNGHYNSRDGDSNFLYATQPFVAGPSEEIPSAIRFDGRSAYANARPYGGISATGGYALSFWFRTSAKGAMLVSPYRGGNKHSEYDRFIRIDLNGCVAASVGTETVVTPSGIDYADGNWHHLVHTFNAKATPQKLYIDGLLVKSGTVNATPNHELALIIFTWIGGVGAHPNGDFAALRLFDRELTASDVEQLSLEGAPLAFQRAWDFRGDLYARGHDSPFVYPALAAEAALPPVPLGADDDQRAAQPMPEFVGGPTPGIASALRFNGSAGYNLRARPVGGISGTNYSLSLWFKVTSKNQILIGTVLQNHQYDRELYIDTTGRVCSRLWIWLGGSTAPEDVISSPAGRDYADGKWHHAAHTVSSITAHRLYVDGALVASGAAIASIEPDHDELRFGARSPIAGEPNGDIAGVKLFNKALSATEVHKLYRQSQSVGVRMYSETSAKLLEHARADFLYDSTNYAALQSLPEKDSANFVGTFAEKFHVLDREPKDVFDFYGWDGCYGWEVFFYMPWLIAKRFMEGGDYESARRWLHYLFDPTLEAGERRGYWVCRPLREADAVSYITDPDAVARLQPMHYQDAIIHQYYENLMAAGDALYRNPTRETMRRAQMWYVAARNLLGDKPMLLQVDDWASPSLGAAQESHFKMPVNETQLSYWDHVDERLYNIRHSLSIDGKPLALPLLEPPINPRLLQLAAMSGGVSVLAAQMSGALLPHYRFAVLLERARGYVAQLSQLGNALQGALERQDAESLSLVQQGHQVELLSLGQAIQMDQIAMEEYGIAGLQVSQQAARERRDFYRRRYDANVTPSEAAVMAMSTAAGLIQAFTFIPEILGGAFACIPNIYGVAIGGQRPDQVAFAASRCMTAAVQVLQLTSERVADIERYRQRREDYELQFQQAELDNQSLAEQINAAKQRIAQARRNLHLQEVQTAQAQAVQRLMQQRFGNEAMYRWMVGRISSLYYQAYDATMSLCRQVEAACQYELGDFELRFINAQAAWNDQFRGLLAGESMMLDLQRMELGYQQRHERRLEIAKIFSLKSLGQSASPAKDYIAELKANGAIEFGFTEEQFDADYPSHFLRQIKTVSVTFPALLGPYQSVGASLTQLSNTLFLTPAKSLDDERGAVTNLRAYQQVALSRGLDDSGLFQLEFNDARYLPFEGTGVTSQWQLAFPGWRNVNGNPAKELLDNLTDVIVQVRYTARG